MKFKAGDFVVIDHKVDDPQWEWIPMMDNYIGLTGIIEESGERLSRSRAPQVEYAAVETYFNGPGIAFIYRVEALRMATPAEVSAFKLIHLLRKE